MPHKLLLADDSVTIQRVIELTFADEDVRVTTVGDGKQAIERILADHPDIVLADTGMPERDGYEVAAFVKGHPELKHVPVLLLTGAFEPIDEGRARAVGCDGVLVKPFEPQMVINRVKDLLAGKRPAGLWAAATIAPQPAPPPKPATPPASDLDLRTPQPPPQRPAAGASLEEYFDRLDAAFAERDPGQKDGASPSTTSPGGVRAPDSQAARPSDALAGWDPDLPGDPQRQPAQEPAFDTPTVDTRAPSVAPSLQTPPAPAVPLQTTAAPQPVATAAAVAEPPSRVLPQGASLAEAFAALLSAEQGHAIAPASARPEDLPDATIDDLVKRVIERMGADAVRQTVLDVAERLVREEIERIKRGG